MYLTEQSDCVREFYPIMPRVVLEMKNLQLIEDFVLLGFLQFARIDRCCKS